MATEEKVTSENNVIKIYNPLDFPFGHLSNNYIQDLVIEEKRYPSVTNYIFSNMLITPIYKLILQEAPIQPPIKKTNIEDKVKQIIANIESRQKYKLTSQEIENIRQTVITEVSLQQMNIHQLYDYYLVQEYSNALRTAVEKAYNAKVVENKVLANFLLSTENRPIVYVSGNSMLGNGPDNNGLNFIGKILMQIRHNLRMIDVEKTKKEQEQNQEQNIIDIYRAINILKQELASGNDLTEYIGKPPAEIIRNYFDKNPRKTLESVGLGENIKESILDMFKRGDLPIVEKEMKNPGYIVLAARRDNLRLVQEYIELQKAEIIVKKYTEYTIRKKYPKMKKKNIEKAAEQLIKQAPSPEEYDKLRKNIVKEYFKGKFSEDLNEEIEKELENLQTITDQDVEDAEQMIAPYEIEPEEDNPQQTSSSSSEENPIKRFLGDSDEKVKKNMIITQLQKYTGKAYRKYKSWSIDKLEKELQKYTGEEPVKQPEEGTGNWVISVKHKNNKIEILKKSTGSRPTQKDVKKLISRYNNKNPDKEIGVNQISVRWESSVNLHDAPKQVRFRTDVEEISPSFIKYVGEPIEIKPIVDSNPPELQELSPLFPKVFTVDGFTYPSVSIYITTMLITQTGIKQNMLDKTIFSRGTPVAEARSLLISNPNTNEFVTPDQATQIYNQRKFSSFRELQQTYARIGMTKKFEDVLLGQILILTGKNKIIYEDPYDNVLGIGTPERPGENIGGVILTEIREKIKNMSKYEIYSPIVKDDSPSEEEISESIIETILYDKFINSWIEMRLNDMCSIVYKMQQYLLIVGKQPEDIDYRFVKRVLDIIYQPCSELILAGRQNQIPLPENFVDMVKNCQGFSQKLSTDYKAELDAIQNELAEYNKNFYGYVEKEEKDLTKNLSPQKFSKSIEVFKSQVPPPSDEQVAEYEKSLLQEFEGMKKQENDFEQKQRREFRDFVNNLFQPELPWKKIYKIIQKERNESTEKIEEAMATLPGYQKIMKKVDASLKALIPETIEKMKNKRRKEIYDFENSKAPEDRKDPEVLKKFIKDEMKKIELNVPPTITKQMRGEAYAKMIAIEKEVAAETTRQTKRLENLWATLTKPKLSKQQLDEKLQEFIQIQQNERKQHFGVTEVKPKTKDEMNKYNEVIKGFKERILRIKQREKKEKRHIELNQLNIASVYWDRLAAMLNIVGKIVVEKKLISIDYIKPEEFDVRILGSKNAIREIIVNAELLNSSDATCQNMIENLPDPYDNCISSAIANLLVGIQGFKYEYQEDIPFGKHDIDLAVSIILGRDVEEIKPIEGDIADIFEEELDEEELQELQQYEENDDDFTPERDDYGSVEENFSGEENFSFSRFGMKKTPNEKKEIIRTILSEIAKKPVSDDIVNHFIESITVVKTSKLPERIKRNRINFFATLR